MLEQRKRVVAAMVALVVVLAVFLFVVPAVRGTGSSLDPELKRTADRALPVLGNPHGKLPVNDASLKSFQAWVYNLEPAFVQISRWSLPDGQYMQLDLTDPTTMPPQALALNAPGKAVVNLSDAVGQQVGQTGQGAWTTMTQNGQSLRMYVVPIRTPAALKASSVSGLLLVVAPHG